MTRPMLVADADYVRCPRCGKGQLGVGLAAGAAWFKCRGRALAVADGRVSPGEHCAQPMLALRLPAGLVLVLAVTPEEWERIVRPATRDDGDPLPLRELLARLGLVRSDRKAHS